MNQYLVSISETFDVTYLVNAVDETVAKKIFMEWYCLKDGYFQDHLYEKSVNMSFAEQFWFNTQEEAQVFHGFGDVIATNEQFEERVRKYFGKNKKWAQMYINYFFAPMDEIRDFEFPEDMIRFLYFKEEKWIDLVFIDLSDAIEINPMDVK